MYTRTHSHLHMCAYIHTDVFKRFGQVARADVFADGVGSVTFDSPNDAREAVNGAYILYV